MEQKASSTSHCNHAVPTYICVFQCKKSIIINVDSFNNINELSLFIFIRNINIFFNRNELMILYTYPEE